MAKYKVCKISNNYAQIAYFGGFFVILRSQTSFIFQEQNTSATHYSLCNLTAQACVAIITTNSKTIG